MTYKYVQTKTTLLRITIEESRPANNNFLTCRTSLAKLRAVKNRWIKGSFSLNKRLPILPAILGLQNLYKLYLQITIIWKDYIFIIQIRRSNFWRSIFPEPKRTVLTESNRKTSTLVGFHANLSIGPSWEGYFLHREIPLRSTKFRKILRCIGANNCWMYWRL